MDTDTPVDENPEDAEGEVIGGQSAPRLGSRVLLTWVELTVVGISGAILGSTVGGPPGFIVYLATSLATVGIVFYNVNALIKGWMGVTAGDEGTDE